MGGGYSGKFYGTEGARGEQQTYQSTFFDNYPVRTKLDGVGTGGSGVGIGGGGADGVDLLHRKKKCSCCGENSIPIRTEYIMCPVCGWIDDPYQNKHLDSLNGQNAISLNQARESYKRKHSS